MVVAINNYSAIAQLAGLLSGSLNTHHAHRIYMFHYLYYFGVLKGVRGSLRPYQVERHDLGNHVLKLSPIL